ncbi:MAG: hypothetical protein IKT14_00125 [Clostridiales bacterium]|nr:hypothetical protein [Clostridiales bacterium]MBR6483398.1 hypothetical protein [Clostridiales bacterium]
MKKNGQPQNTNRTPGMMTLIAIAMMLVSLLVMFILCLVPGRSANSRNPVLLVYGDDSNFPVLSMENSMHAIGFDVETADESYVFDEERNYIIMGVGEYAFNYVDAYKEQPEVKGFVLVCPGMPASEIMEGMSGTYPSREIAIFAGKDDASKVSDMGSARVIYERISGDDTVYGTPITRGGKFSSKVYINNIQTRYLSLSFAKIKDADKFLFSPLFQNELAGYLSTTYQDLTIRDASFSRINAWYVWALISFFTCLVGMCLYLAALPLIMSDMKQETIHKGEKLSAALIGGISIALAIGTIATTFVEKFRTYASCALCLMPLIFMVIMTFNKSRFILDNKVRYIKKQTRPMRPLFISLTVVLLVFLSLRLFTDLQLVMDLPAMVIAPCIFILDLMCSSALLYADRKSRYMGQGGSSYFGNRVIFLLMLIPSVFAMIFGLVFRLTDIFYAGFAGLTSTLVPFVSLIPLRRHTDHSLIPGIVHAVIYTAVVFAML